MGTHRCDWARTRITVISRPKTANSIAEFSRVLLHLAIGLVIFIYGPSVSQTSASSLSTSITIKAQVLPFVKLTNLRDQKNIVISERDADRGLVEIGEGSVIEIKNNNPNGCYLLVEVNGFPFEWASVNLQGKEVTLSERGGFIHWQSQGSIVTPIHYVIRLKPGTKPGVYPWPFRLTASF